MVQPLRVCFIDGLLKMEEIKMNKENYPKRYQKRPEITVEARDDKREYARQYMSLRKYGVVKQRERNTKNNKTGGET